MKNKKNNIKTIIIIVLIGIIIALISVILATKKENIEKEVSSKEQLTTTSSDNAYVSMTDHLSELNNIETTIGKTTVTADKILKDYTAYKDGKIITGTMANRTNTTTAWSGYETIALQAHPSDASQGLVTITNSYGFTGYYDSTSKITGNIANLNAANIRAGVKVGRVDGTSGITGTYTNDATATAADIASGKTAYVNGSKITGTATLAENLGLTLTRLKNFGYYGGDDATGSPTKQTSTYTFTDNYDYALVLGISASSIKLTSSSSTTMTSISTGNLFKFSGKTYLITKPVIGDKVTYTGGTGSNYWYQGLHILGINIE